jgi:GT2 family glycosyltransferase
LVRKFEKYIDVSVVIVCMNNLKNLYPCLDSIKKHTTLSYEILVVAYLFSKENLQKLRTDYPWITIIESNEIRGFSENNNLALREAIGKYCLILNDDTYFSDNSIYKLVNSYNLYSDVDIISPLILYPNEKVQYCGLGKYSFLNWLLRATNLLDVFSRKKDIFNEHFVKTVNITGACFIIKTEVLKTLEYFDEDYFFVPEDIALSTKAYKLGYKSYVNLNAKVYHIHASSSTKISQIILPVISSGIYLFFYKNEGILVEYIVRLIDFILTVPRLIYWTLNVRNSKRTIMINALLNIQKFAFIKIRPKLLFQKLIKVNNIKLI